jgi:PAS domain S-box-containing protein
MKGLSALNIVAATIAALLLLSSGPIYGLQTEQPETKRILVLYSYHEGLPWDELIDQSFRNTLAFQSDFSIEINVEHTDRVRHADDEYRHKLIDLYRHKYSQPKMDLIIGVDDEAVGMLLDFGEKVFPEIPIVLITAERKNFQRALLKPHMTSLLWGLDTRANVELIGEILPQTRHIFVVAGTSPSDHEALKLAQASLREDTKRFAIDYLTDISANDLIKEATQLPERSAILYLVFSRDAEGKSFVPRKILSILSKQASVPVFGVLDTYLGYGIVGGNMLSAEVQGRRCAEIALRIFRGESPVDIIPERTLNQLMFDWRQLKRWGISEDKLPPGSIVRFKTYSFWELYRGYIVAAIILILIQSGLISFLLWQRAQRRRAQAQLAERLRFEEMLFALSARFVNLPPNRLDAEIKRVLESIGKGLHVDRVSVFEISGEDEKLHLVHSHKDAEIEAPPSEVKFEQLPWVRQKLFNGEMLTFSDPEDLPAEAAADRNFLRAQGIISLAVIPLSTSNKTMGLLSLAMLRHRKNWPHELIRQCRLVAEVFANAMTRKQQEEALVQAEEKYRTVADFTYDWEYWAKLDDSLEYVSPSCERISGYTIRDFIDNPSFFKEIIVPEDRDVWERHYHDARKELKPYEIQFRIKRRDGEIRWIEHSCQPVMDRQGTLQGFRASNRDITSRKLAEVDLRKAYAEIEQLKNRLEAETAYLQQEIKLEHNFESIVGISAALKYVLYKVEQVAAADTTVLVLGETGTGKELVARAIHNYSPHSVRPLVKVNCATLSPHLIESELFGHERGAFTGAETRQLGRFEVADGTSIFLDEIGELSPDLQVKLLRVLEHGEFERLGSSRSIKVDVRVIAATNRDLEEEVRKGRFREDLFYRLNVFPITVPPLRQRAEDIALLTQFFVEKASKRLGKSIEQIPESVMQKLRDYSWPGNVRELENVIERAVINSSGPRLRLADDLAGQDLNRMSPPLKSLQETEKDHILRMLQSTNWRIDGANGAALILDMNPSTLRSRMRKLGIQKPKPGQAGIKKKIN